MAQLEQAADALEREDAAEAIHDLRVAARRLAALLRLLKTALPQDSKRARKLLRKIVQSTSNLRDIEVQVNALRGRQRDMTESVERAALEFELARLGARRNRLRARTLAKLEHLELSEIAASAVTAVERCEHGLRRHEGRKFAELVHAAVERHLEGALVAAPETDDAVAARHLHRARLAFKKLRYTLELLSPEVVEEDLVGRIRGTQRILGNYHDQVLLVLELEQRVQRLEDLGCVTLANGLRRELANAREAQRDGFEKARASLSEALRDELRNRVLSALPAVPSRRASVRTAHLASVRPAQDVEASA